MKHIWGKTNLKPKYINILPDAYITILEQSKIRYALLTGFRDLMH